MMRSINFLATFALATCGLLALSTRVAAQVDSTEGAAPVSVFGERVEVSVVNLEVFVTDGEGRPARGLVVGDFTLLEDGKPVEITNFSAIENGEVARLESESATVEGAAAAPVAPPPVQRLSVVVYVDSLNLQPASRKRALGKVKDFLATLPAGSRLMRVSGERSPRVVVPPTEKTAELVSGLEVLAKSKPQGIEGAMARTFTLRAIRAAWEESGCTEVGVDQMRAYASSYARSRFGDEAVVMSNLKQVIGSLAGLTGRKALLHVSDGIPLRVGAEAYALVNQLCPGTFDVFASAGEDLTSHLHAVTSTANANGVTFYTMEAAGLRAASSSSAEFAGRSLDAEQDFEDRNNYQDVIFNLASETGGRAFLNTNQLEVGLAKVAEDLSNFYSLGYMPSSTGGRPRTLEVRVTKPGYKVRHRRAVRTKEADEIAEERVLSSLLLGQGDNPLGAQLATASGVPAGKEQLTVPFRLLVPLSKVTLLPTGERLVGELRLKMVVRDERGNTSPLRSLTVPVDVPAGAAGAAGRTFAYEMKLTLRYGDHRLALAVEDGPSQVASYLAYDFRVGDKPGR